MRERKEGDLCFFVAWLLSSSHPNLSKCFVKIARDT
jgi:hypothetical protein